MKNLEKLLIFVADEKLMDEMIKSIKDLEVRSQSSIEDMNQVKDKLKNIRKLCQEK
jgi:chaperonin cofactor prefoldin